MAGAGPDEKLRISDEDWLISRAKTCLNDDEYAAKAWLLTARTLFPRNLSIQVRNAQNKSTISLSLAGW